MTYIVVDVESDNSSPANGSIVCFGAVKVSNLECTYYGRMCPISANWNPEALAISGFTREEHLMFHIPPLVMANFYEWVVSNTEPGKRPIFISDNLAFDWQWINYYFHKFLEQNPFGHSGRRIGDLYCGLVKDASKNWEWKKKFRKTKHDHNPINDALGNAEALLEMQKMGLKVNL